MSLGDAARLLAPATEPPGAAGSPGRRVTATGDKRASVWPQPVRHASPTSMENGGSRFLCCPPTTPTSVRRGGREGSWEGARAAVSSESPGKWNVSLSINAVPLTVSVYGGGGASWGGSEEIVGITVQVPPGRWTRTTGESVSAPRGKASLLRTFPWGRDPHCRRKDIRRDLRPGGSLAH